MAKPTVFTGAWARMAEAAGGVGELAQALHVDRGTLLRWTKGQNQPDDFAVTVVKAWCESRGIESPWQEAASEVKIAPKVPRPLSRGEKNLLKKCSDKTYEFTKGGSQEQSAFELFRVGLLERKQEVYRVGAGGQSMELRWAYRRTTAGRDALKSSNAT